MKTYKPTAVDITWMKQMVASLTIGGLWGYKNRPIMFKKIAENTMALVEAPFDDLDVLEQIERNKVVMKEAGIEFVDQRNRR